MSTEEKAATPPNPQSPRTPGTSPGGKGGGGSKQLAPGADPTALWRKVGGFPPEKALDAFNTQVKALVELSEQIELDANREQHKVKDTLQTASGFHTETQRRIGRRNKRLLETGKRLDTMNKK